MHRLPDLPGRLLEFSPSSLTQIDSAFSIAAGRSSDAWIALSMVRCSASALSHNAQDIAVKMDDTTLPFRFWIKVPEDSTKPMQAS